MDETNYQQYGLVRIANVSVQCKAADVKENALKICDEIQAAADKQVSLVVFGQNALTTLSCGDALLTGDILQKCALGLSMIKRQSQNIAVIVGCPWIVNSKVYNCYFVFADQQLLGVIPSEEVCDVSEISDAGLDMSFCFGNELRFVCETNNDFNFAVVSGKTLFESREPEYLYGANIVVVIDDGAACIGSAEYRRTMIRALSYRSNAAVVYNGAGFCNTDGDRVYDGDLCVCQNGNVFAQSRRFSIERQAVYADVDTAMAVHGRIRNKNSYKSVKNVTFRQNKNLSSIDTSVYNTYIGCSASLTEQTFSEIMNIAVGGLCKRMQELPADTKCVLGVSGGLDSTLALMVIDKTMAKLNRPKTDILAVTMPGFGTTSKTRNNAVDLCRELNIPIEEHSIKDIAKMMLNTVGQSESDKNTVYENVQARARTYLLMTLANKVGGIVVGTGDLSESALGWATYNGDHISMYNPIADIPKTLVKATVNYLGCNADNAKVGDILREISTQVISPELLPSENDKIAQSTEDIIGPYELHDCFLYFFVRHGFGHQKIRSIVGEIFKYKYDDATVEKWLDTFLRRFGQNQWKRDCSPAGPQIGSVCLSPRGSWNMSTDIKF